MNKKAFTLIELLVVIVLMAIIIGISVPMFSGISQGQALRGATRSIASTLSLSRQWAITHRTPVRFAYVTINSNGTPYSTYTVKDGTDNTIIQKEERLADGVAFDINGVSGADDKNRYFTFKSDGGINLVTQDQEITIADIRKPNDVHKKIIVNWLTGGVRVED